MSVQRENRTFLESQIWSLQRSFFEETGIESWSRAIVPHYVTSNPVVGRTYAELVLALLRDLAVQGQTVEPVYLIELGAGHGRLCYHFFKYFEKYYRESSIILPPFVYILSDFTEANLAFWRTHPRLQPFITKGFLDFALFDAEKSSEIKLEIASRTIKMQELQQPLLAVANYFFDSIPQDLFYLYERSIYNCQVSIGEELDIENMSAFEAIDGIDLEFEYSLITDDVYQDQLQKTIINNYIQKLDNTHLMFPKVGIECVERLRHLSSKGLVLLTADKGSHYLTNLDNLPQPRLSKHGSFSLDVNYHAFKEHCNLSGGRTFFSRHQQAHIDIGCLMYLDNHAIFKETSTSFEKNVNDFGPDDYFSLKRLIETNYSTLSIRDIFAVIRLSGYDAHIFKQMTSRLLDLIPEITDEEKWNLYQAIPRVWDTYYPIGEATDLAGNLGLILYNLDFYDDALTYFEKSLALYGKKAHILYNIALCNFYLGKLLSSKIIVDNLLKEDPENGIFQELLSNLEKEAMD